MKQIACLGDSNTFGFDPQSLWGGRYAKESRWPERIAAAGFSVRNLGVNGLGVTRESVHAVLAQELFSGPPSDLAILMLGTNDLLMGLSAEETAGCMKKLLALLCEKKAAGRFLLIAPVPLQSGTWVPDDSVITQSLLLSKRYRRLAAELGADFADAGQWNIPLAYDGVHFTEEGHRIFAEKLLEHLRSAAGSAF